MKELNYMNIQNNYLPPIEEEYPSRLEIVYPEYSNTKKPYSITFQVTEDCCMACTYCYQHHKTNNKMSWEIAKNIIDKLLTNEFPVVTTDNCFAIIFDFIGGEPLIEIDLIDQIVSYTLKQMIQLKHPWTNLFRISICSNGLLYQTEKVQKFLKKYSSICSFTISVDGNEQLHDTCRLDINGNKTYNTVIKAIRHYKKFYTNNISTKMTLSPNNIQYTYDALINLIQENYKIIHFNCIFEKGWNYSHATILYNELKKIADYLINNNLYSEIGLKMFNENWYSPMDISDDKNWCGGVNMKTLAFDGNGNIYPCIRYMDSSLNGKQPAINLGNIYNGYLSTEKEKENLQLISNITRRSQSTDECFYCPIANGCAWCSGYNYEEFGTPNKRTTYICCMHQAASLANVYYWNKLYQKLNINKKFEMYLSKEKALNIIDEKEYNYLLNLSKGV